MKRQFLLTIGFCIVVFGEARLPAETKEPPLVVTLDELVSDGSLIAAQAVVGRGDQILVDHAVGVTMPGGSRQVNPETLFCIGSCSKPIASAIIMSLVDDGLLELDRPIGRYLPAFEQLKLSDGQSSPAPTIKELLAHRSGIYSQKKGMTRRQASWIRNFGLTLAESVQRIAGEPLIGPPGTQYAYSGAGYCVVGRVAEVVSGNSFEQLLQTKIAAPLGLKRTTYFPDAEDKNVAAGGINKKANPATPHLTKPTLRLALIGGSLYSTARETAQIIRLVAEQGKRDGAKVMTQDSWNTWISRPYADAAYGFGWFLNGPASEPAVSVSHSGSLASSRSNVVVVLGTGAYCVVHYSVVAQGNVQVSRKIKQSIASTLRLNQR